METKKIPVYDVVWGEGKPELEVAKILDVECESDVTVENLAYEICTKHLKMDRLIEEVLYLFGYDENNELLGVSLVSKGTRNECSVITKTMVFTRVLLMEARKFVTIHNHPHSKNLGPSDDDIEFFEYLDYYAKLMKLDMMDWYIVGERDMYVGSLQYKPEEQSDN